ncbi:component of oligomeric golgi family complex [Anopheles darlingi]|uniref:Conserved oligomeric Golgi complex subunit 6 n=1 Tax=Anopheles darlingi TaxID=43151 RepID=W5JX60_ANODA|nr:conserved oligomeric Golgi complex subunit 6 [Anopheles darlingi]ETN67849.1 component of oligomeric golgi family complex [Anopheles darlingi]
MATTETKEDYIQQRLNKVLESRIESDRETLDALSDLSSFFKENTLQTRRNLRSQIEKRSLEINQRFLDAFRNVKEVLDGICEDINSMGQSVECMKSQLRSTEAQTKELIQQANTLQEENSKLQVQQKIANGFLSRFQLSVVEHQMLYGAKRDAPITGEFFQVLDRVQSIHTDCRTLMQSGYQTVALDIMEEMTLHQEAALERLYRWTQSHCRNVDSNEMGVLIVEAMARLQERPVLFKYVIDEYSTARRSVVVRSFIDALTIGGPGGNPRPIEMLAHDPKRYIGDMFAYIHQILPPEKESLQLLVRNCDKEDISEQIKSAMVNVSDGVCHPLRVRVETILNAEKDTIVLYSIFNLIKFYQNMINGIVKGGQLEQCMADLQIFSETTYLNSLTFQVKQLLQGPNENRIGLEPPQTDLVPSASVGRLLNLLKEILSVASMVAGSQADIVKIVGCVIDPLLQSVQESASHLPTTDMAVYLLNSLYQIESVISIYEYMEERLERLRAQSDAQIDTLTSEQASSLVANLNLGPIYTVLQGNASQIDQRHLQMFVNKLEQFLHTPEILLLPQVNLLVSSSHRATVQKRSFNVIIAIYRQIYERINDPANGYTNPETILSKTPEQVAELLCG